MKNNKLVFPLIMVSMCAIMYCFAFHEMRDERDRLRKEIELLKSTKK